jgi:hypothetical protein
MAGQVGAFGLSPLCILPMSSLSGSTAAEYDRQVGRRVKLVADAALAQPHAAGSTVWLNLPCVHGELGALFVRQVPHLALHIAYARQLRAEMTKLNTQVEALDVETSGGRSVSDKVLVANLYIVGTTLAIHIVLAFQHLVLTLEALSPANTGGMDLTARFSAVLKRLGNRLDLRTDPGYARLCEIQDLRHAIEHPTTDNTYTANENDWDRVPLTWIASGRAATAFDLALEFLTTMAAFATKVAGRRKGPDAFVNVKRGIKAVNQAKKPPARRARAKK